MTRKMVKLKVGTLDIESVDAKDVIKCLQIFIDDHSPNELTLELQSIPYSEFYEVGIYVNRPESDYEKQVREWAEQKLDEQRELYAKKQYEELKKRFG